MKKISVFLILGIIIFMIVSCSADNTKIGLSIWIGTYIFEEQALVNLKLSYEITIYEEDGEYFAIIIRKDPINNRVPITYLYARVFGNEEWISMTLIEPTGVLSTGCRVDDILISFRRENGNIYTYWGTFFAWAPENFSSNKVYFRAEDASQVFELPDRLDNDLSVWVGTYTFETSRDNFHWGETTRHYEVVIYEEDGEYFARIFTEEGEPTKVPIVDGVPAIFKPEVIEARGKVIGGEEWISLTTLEFLLNGEPLYPSEIDRVLMSFRREDENIYTYWGMIGGYTRENKSNMVHFEKVD